MLAMPSLRFDDSTNANSIPADAEACAGYVAGAWQSYWPLVARFPHLAAIGRVVSYTPVLGPVARIADRENGDMSAAQAAQHVRTMISKGVFMPGVYANESDMPAVKASLAQTGLNRSHYVLHLANWDGIAQVPYGYDAKQFAGGVSLPFDQNVALDTFFPPLAPPKPPPPHGVAKAELEFDLATSQWTLKPLPGTVVWQEVSRWASLEVQVGAGGKLSGQWRTKPLEWNAPPLGS